MDYYTQIPQRVKERNLLDQMVTLKSFTEETKVKFLGLVTDDHGTLHVVIRRADSTARCELVHFSCIVDLMEDVKE